MKVRASELRPYLAATLAAMLLVGCGEDRSGAGSNRASGAGPERTTAQDPAGDVAEDSELGGPADRQRLDLRRVTLVRSGESLKVTFDTVEQPGDAQTQRLIASNPSGVRSVVIEAVLDDNRLEGLYRAPSAARRPVTASRDGSEVTVSAPLDDVTSAPSFRWQARTISPRQVPEIADRLPGVDSERLVFPAP